MTTFLTRFWIRTKHIYSRLAKILGIAGREQAVVINLANQAVNAAQARVTPGEITDYSAKTADHADDKPLPIEKIPPLPYALMSSACYGNEPPFERLVALGWRKLMDYSEETHGYDGTAYFHAATGELVFAHQGTTDWSLAPGGDGDDNAQLATQYTDQFTQRIFNEEQLVDPVTAPPGQFSAALEFIDAVQILLNDSNEKIVVTRQTGHSLGGAVADLVAAALGMQAITFDTPGTAEIIRENPLVFPNAAQAAHMAWQSEQGIMRHQGNLPGKAAALSLDDASGYEDLLSDTVNHIKTNHDINRIVASIGTQSGFPKRHSQIQTGSASYTKDQHYNR